MGQLLASRCRWLATWIEPHLSLPHGLYQLIDVEGLRDDGNIQLVNRLFAVLNRLRGTGRHHDEGMALAQGFILRHDFQQVAAIEHGDRKSTRLNSSHMSIS